VLGVRGAVDIKSLESGRNNGLGIPHVDLLSLSHLIMYQGVTGQEQDGSLRHHLLLHLKITISILFVNPPERFALRGIHDKKFLERTGPLCNPVLSTNFIRL
jgi:hypothetical protein